MYKLIFQGTEGKISRSFLIFPTASTSTGSSVSNRFRRSLSGLILLSSLLILTAGCAMVTPRYPDIVYSEFGGDIRSYARHVFRHQNIVSSRLLLRMEETRDQEEYAKLAGAEERILDACSVLNEVAIMKAEKGVISRAMKHKVYHSLERCDNTTRDVEVMLRDL